MQEKLSSLKKESEARLAEKTRIEKQLATAKQDNLKLLKQKEEAEAGAKSSKEDAEKAREEAEKAAEKQTPEQYLEEAAEEMDLSQMAQYSQMVTFKYMKMQAEYNFEQTKKGGAAAAQNMQWQQLAAMMQ